MRKLLLLCPVLLGAAILFPDAVGQTYHLSPRWSAAPGDPSKPYVTSTGGAGTPNERGIAYNALSNQLYVVQRSGNNYTVHVVDASSGSKLYNLKTNGIVPVVTSEVTGANGIGLVAIDVADDGAVYACNESPNASGGSNPFSTNKLFRVYRWSNSDSNTLPTQIFEGDPASETGNFRWGDVLDARGSGTNTQIILDNQSALSRYLAILRPTDANLNSFASTFFFQDTATPFGTSIGRSLEFGVADTVWQKRKAAALLLSSFDFNADPKISPLVATHANFPGALGLVGMDLTRNLLAGINFATVATVPDTLDLYDISDRENPVLLAQYNFPINHVANNNSIGRVLFAGNQVFALDGNNGILAFTVATGPVSAPTILQQPQGLRLVAGSSGTLRVVTAEMATYQWQLNTTNIVGATNSSYAISNAKSSDAGNYRVIVRNDAGPTTSSNAVVTVLPAENFHRLAPLWSLAPESRDYLLPDTDGQGRTPLYRAIAYSALSNQVYLITRSGQTAGLAIYALNAATGEDLYPLNTEPVSDGTIVLLAMGVAEDGALYAANMVDLPANASLTYNLYRWENSDANTVPALVYSGDPGSALSGVARWGDTMAVRGAGTNTEVLIDGNSGTLAALLRPVDASMNSFTPATFTQSYGPGSIGRSLEFGVGNTFWQKRKDARLQLSIYDPATQSSSVITNYESFPNSLGPVALDLSRNLLAGINFSADTNAPDTLDLYDISDFNRPLRIANYNFPTSSQPNGNFIGQVVFAGNRVFAVDGNNGIVAFTLVPPEATEAPTLSIARSGADVVLSWPSSATGFVLEKTPGLSPPDWKAVDRPVIEVNGRNTVTESAPSSGNAFYRARRP
jgi:hypothetical protein